MVHAKKIFIVENRLNMTHIYTFEWLVFYMDLEAHIQLQWLVLM